MSLTAYAQWPEGYDIFQVEEDENPQTIADHIVVTKSIDCPIGHPDTITIFRNGDNCPVYVRQYANGIDYQG